MNQATPTIEQVKALHGRNAAMLTAAETEILKHYERLGRKEGVAVAYIRDSGPTMEQLASASVEERRQLLREGNYTIRIITDQNTAQVFKDISNTKA